MLQTYGMSCMVPARWSLFCVCCMRVHSLAGFFFTNCRVLRPPVMIFFKKLLGNLLQRRKLRGNISHPWAVFAPFVLCIWRSTCVCAVRMHVETQYFSFLFNPLSRRRFSEGGRHEHSIRANLRIQRSNSPRQSRRPLCVFLAVHGRQWAVGGDRTSFGKSGDLIYCFFLYPKRSSCCECK